METNGLICTHCERFVYQWKRVGIMVDGILQVSVPVCTLCYEEFNDYAMPLLDRKVTHAI